MCLIIVCPPKVRPSRDILNESARLNPHGAGIAWREGGAVHWLKTDSVGEIEDLATRKSGEIVIHFRIASVGGVTPALRHPFPVSRRAGLAPLGNAKAVLFQNGTWPEWQVALENAARAGEYVPAGEMNDTRAAAVLVNGVSAAERHAFFPKTGASRWVWFAATATERYGTWFAWRGMRFSNDWLFRSARLAAPSNAPAAAPQVMKCSVSDWVLNPDQAAKEFYSRFPKPVVQSR